MTKYLGIIFGVFVLIGSFVVAEKAKADDTDIVINEVMFYPSNEDTGEFIELYNQGRSDINLLDYYIKDNTSKDEFIQFTKKDFGQRNSFLLSPKSYAIILDPDYTDNYDQFISSYLCDDCLILTIKNALIGNGLNKDGDRVELYKIGTPDMMVDSISWQKVDILWQNHSYEENSDGKWYKSLEGGTPGSENSVLSIKAPIISEKDLFPKNDQKFSIFEEIIFSWKKEGGVNYEYQITKDENFINLINESGLTVGKFYWRLIAKNEIYTIYSLPQSFEIYEPVYSKNIIINEICPHPQNGVANEFIELFNTGSEEVDLGGWFLDDAENSGSTPYEIPVGTKIKAGKYIAFYKAETGISLADNGDTARLLFPNGNLTSLISYNEYASLGYSWARKSDGSWQWTTTSTFGDENKFTQPITEEKVDTEEPINTVPIEIATGSYQDYLNRLVKVTGKVTSTSGNTFYLDDGSGEVKIYIQEKTGIDKPEMHKNDIFEVIGVVDLYGKTWRILPQKQDDIQLIEAAKSATTTKSSTAKKTSSSKTTADSVSKAIGIAASIGPKTVEAAQTSTASDNTAEKSSFWIQLLEALIGIAAISLLVLIVKLRQRPKEPTIGGHFGDDET